MTAISHHQVRGNFFLDPFVMAVLRQQTGNALEDIIFMIVKPSDLYCDRGGSEPIHIRYV